MLRPHPRRLYNFPFRRRKPLSLPLCVGRHERLFSQKIILAKTRNFRRIFNIFPVMKNIFPKQFPLCPLDFKRATYSFPPPVPDLSGNSEKDFGLLRGHSGWYRRGVAQLARAPVSKTGGCGFETLRPCQISLNSVSTGPVPTLDRAGTGCRLRSVSGECYRSAGFDPRRIDGRSKEKVFSCQPVQSNSSGM